jgi:S1-C subfamily serine protease
MRRLALVGFIAAVVGVGAVSGALFAAGGVGGSTSAAAAVARRHPSPERSSLTAPLNAAELYAAANPSVVAITATHPTSVDTGTGFVIDSDGHVLTADHVVSGASTVTLKFQDGFTVPAEVLGQDPSTDVAVLQVRPSPARVPALALGSTSSLAVGDMLAVIGNPFGYDSSLSTGVVSALDRTIQAPSGFLIPDALQTDATINPGNSGGPVLDAQGSVVGIVDQIATGSSSVDSDTGVGFAVPIDLVKWELSELEHGVAVPHAYLGIAAGESVVTEPGALVQGVAGGSPAATGGLRAGDLITGLDGAAIRGPSALVAAIAAHKPGNRLTLRVRRGSSTVTVAVTLAAQPSAAPVG